MHAMATFDNSGHLQVGQTSAQHHLTAQESPQTCHTDNRPHHPLEDSFRGVGYLDLWKSGESSPQEGI